MSSKRPSERIKNANPFIPVAASLIKFVCDDFESDFPRARNCPMPKPRQMFLNDCCDFRQPPTSCSRRWLELIIYIWKMIVLFCSQGADCNWFHMLHRTLKTCYFAFPLLFACWSKLASHFYEGNQILTCGVSTFLHLKNRESTFESHKFSLIETLWYLSRPTSFHLKNCTRTQAWVASTFVIDFAWSLKAFAKQFGKFIFLISKLVRHSETNSCI